MALVTFSAAGGLILVFVYRNDERGSAIGEQVTT